MRGKAGQAGVAGGWGWGRKAGRWQVVKGWQKDVCVGGGVGWSCVNCRQQVGRGGRQQHGVCAGNGMPCLLPAIAMSAQKVLFHCPNHIHTKPSIPHAINFS